MHMAATLKFYAQQKHPMCKKSEAKSEVIHATKKCDIWLRPRPKLFASKKVKSIMYINSEGSIFHIRCATVRA